MDNFHTQAIISQDQIHVNLTCGVKLPEKSRPTRATYPNGDEQSAAAGYLNTTGETSHGTRDHTRI